MVMVNLGDIVVDYISKSDGTVIINVKNKNVTNYNVLIHALKFIDEDGEHHIMHVHVEKEENIGYTYGWTELIVKDIEIDFYGDQAEKRIKKLQETIEKIIQKRKVIE